MTKLFRLLLALTLILSTTAVCNAAKPTLAVMTIENTAHPTWIAELMTNKLIVAFQNSGRYTLVERDQMAQILREQGFQSLTVDPKDAVEVGKLVGAKYFLFNRVSSAAIYENETNALGRLILKGDIASKYKGKVTVECRIIDNANGVMVFSTVANGTKSGASVEDAINGACIEAAENAVAALERDNPFAARVADIADDTIYIDAGLDSGLKVDEKLIIVREGRPIEVNGKIVGMTQTTVGRAKVVEVNAEYSVCRITAHTDAVRKGDIVKRGK